MHGAGQCGRCGVAPVTTHKKQHLEKKLCKVCQKPFNWRKKWERDWDNVLYCSERCRRTKLKVKPPNKSTDKPKAKPKEKASGEFQ